MEGSRNCTRYDMVLAVKVEPVEEHRSLDGTRIPESTWENSYFTHFGNNRDHTYSKMEYPSTVRVKLEPATDTPDSVKKERGGSDEAVCVDTEPSDSAGPGVSEAATLAGLYADHAVKDEVVVGPERPHRPLIALLHDEAPGVSSWSQESARDPCENLALQDCSVKLGRCDTSSGVVTIEDTATPPSAEHIVTQTHNTVPQTYDILPQTTHDTVPHTTDDPVPQNTENTVAQTTPGSVPQTHDTFQHASTNTYVCDICGKRIRRKDHLIRHINMHLRENSETLSNKLNIYERVRRSKNPYSCKICNKEFTRLDNLQRHERIHTGEKTHSCAICKKQFSQLCNLTAHKRIHTGEKPYSCNMCKMQFAELGTLKKHKRIHTGEKSYACEVCSKVFAYFTTLKRHKRIHTGAKPYTCEICEEGFMRLDTLKTHLKSHMGNKSKAREKKPR